MKFKIGARVTVNGNHTGDFQGFKGIVVSREEFLKHRPDVNITTYSSILLKLNKQVVDHTYWQADPKVCDLLSSSSYND